MMYDVHSLFESVQGEGHWSGTPMTFVRLYGCSEDCPFCDQKMEKGKYEQITEEQIVDVVGEYKNNRVCITGGEPLEQDIKPLVDLLHCEGYTVHLETNGKHVPTASVDWLTISPKGHSTISVHKCDEVKVMIGCVDPVAIHNHVKAKHYWVMPLNCYYKPAYDFVMSDHRFKLGTQMHKYAGIK